LYGAGKIGQGLYGIASGIQDVAKDVGELLHAGKEINVFGKTIGRVFDFLGTAEKINTLVEPIDKAHPLLSVDRARALGSLALEAALVFGGEAEVGVAVKIAVEATGVLNGLIDGADELQEMQKGSDALQKMVKLPPCAPAAQAQAQILADDCNNGLTRLSGHATADLPDIDHLKLIAPQIGDLLNLTDGGKPNLGLTETQLNNLKQLLTDYSGSIDRIDGRGSYSDDIGEILQDVDSLTEMYTMAQSMSGGSVGIVSQPQYNICPLYWAADIGLTTIRGRVDEMGMIQFFAGSTSAVRIRVYNPHDDTYGTTWTTADTSASVRLQVHIAMLPVTGSDMDADGLCDEAESVIGTWITKADSDSDGINDYAEVKQCLNPLDGLSFATGTI